MQKDGSIYKFILGGRGVGKTFGFLKYVIDKLRGTDRKFIFMRRTQTQVDIIQTPDLNPFRALEEELGEDYRFVMKKINKSITGIYRLIEDGEGQFVPDPVPAGYMMALSTVSNIRGFSGADVDYLIYDEFVGEAHEKPIRNESQAFLNAIETIARNRELKGQLPLQVVCLSNSNLLANPLFIGLGFVTACEKAMRKNRDLIVLAEQKSAIYLIHDSPISRKKEQTSLYALAGRDSAFSRMALDNEFTGDYLGMVRSMKLSEYRPVCAVGEIVIYKHKSKREWYVTEHRSGQPAVYDSSEIEIRRWAHDYYYLKLAYMNRHIWFENYVQQVLFEKYIKAG